MFLMFRVSASVHQAFSRFLKARGSRTSPGRGQARQSIPTEVAHSRLPFRSVKRTNTLLPPWWVHGVFIYHPARWPFLVRTRAVDFLSLNSAPTLASKIRRNSRAKLQCWIRIDFSKLQRAVRSEEHT